jgi:hypothetical protein
VAIWYILCLFGTFFSFWYVCTKKNLAALHAPREGRINRLIRSLFAFLSPIAIERPKEEAAEEQKVRKFWRQNRRSS